MEGLVSSQARLTDPDTISQFVDVFSYYLGYSRSEEEYSDVTRFQVLPLVFGLLPEKAIYRDRYDLKVKPLIKKHLHTLGIPEDELLIKILKEIADQYYYTSRESDKFLIKYSIEKLQVSNPFLYKEIIRRQGNRCALCGSLFDGEITETLDHIIPWRLVGDNLKGSNWQILCLNCNSGKREYFSCLQTKAAYNWVYSSVNAECSEHISNETRYVILSQQKCCFYCNRSPESVKLHIKKKHLSGLLVVDNLIAICEHCLNSNEVT